MLMHIVRERATPHMVLDDGSRQEDVWGADWLPETQEVQLEALINIRPRLRNASMIILDPIIGTQVEAIVWRLLGEIAAE